LLILTGNQDFSVSLMLFVDIENKKEYGIGIIFQFAVEMGGEAG